MIINFTIRLTTMFLNVLGNVGVTFIVVVISAIGIINGIFINDIILARIAIVVNIVYFLLVLHALNVIFVR